MTIVNVPKDMEEFVIAFRVIRRVPRFIVGFVVYFYGLREA